MQTGKKLKEYRKKIGLTRQQFSNISLIPVETLRSWEKGRRKLKPWHGFFLQLLKDHLEKSGPNEMITKKYPGKSGQNKNDNKKP